MGHRGLSLGNAICVRRISEAPCSGGCEAVEEDLLDIHDCPKLQKDMRCSRAQVVQHSYHPNVAPAWQVHKSVEKEDAAQNEIYSVEHKRDPWSWFALLSELNPKGVTPFPTKLLDANDCENEAEDIVSGEGNNPIPLKL